MYIKPFLQICRYRHFKSRASSNILYKKTFLPNLLPSSFLLNECQITPVAYICCIGNCIFLKVSVAIRTSICKRCHIHRFFCFYAFHSIESQSNHWYWFDWLINHFGSSKLLFYKIFVYHENTQNNWITKYILNLTNILFYT